ncbi:MAG: tRNA (cytosine(32)/uridine(32)-2'-O)-methyltransferase TrmJ [Gammaproteobacteria bacterium]|nr:tRNA (cytosine(32)/uridine(32)-2'-O)-methyltransferase TrmJ [Gammaproteobacteria bacterium]MCW5582277.1 tRNA (cytosine(32)/uridine(32)-2'-O)-methyltransferase TrmJ [Gammaproteobacteria bacterium]
MLDNIRIVLVHTSHPGNIGAAARAMKTMGLSALYLVAPEQFPHIKAVEMASGASDILDTAVLVKTVEEAIADCTLVIGTSARMRTIPWPLFSPREMSEKVRQESPNSQVAILFGREQSGLSNDELHRCHMHIQIPANLEYSSLNLAAAVQVIAYELRLASLSQQGVSEDWDYRLANVDEMEKFFVHLQAVLIEIGFLKLNAPRQLMTRLRRMFLRTRPDVMEMNILRGMLTAVQEVKK